MIFEPRRARRLFVDLGEGVVVAVQRQGRAREFLQGGGRVMGKHRLKPPIIAFMDPQDFRDAHLQLTEVRIGAAVPNSRLPDALEVGPVGRDVGGLDSCRERLALLGGQEGQSGKNCMRDALGPGPTGEGSVRIRATTRAIRETARWRDRRRRRGENEPAPRVRLHRLWSPFLSLRAVPTHGRGAITRQLTPVANQ